MINLTPITQMLYIVLMLVFVCALLEAMVIMGYWAITVIRKIWVETGEDWENIL